MVRAIVATILKIGRERMTVKEFRDIIETKDCTKASFAVPPDGLFLIRVNYPEDYFQQR
jgi:tRNA pseudouridine38-40 synthase